MSSITLQELAESRKLEDAEALLKLKPTGKWMNRAVHGKWGYPLLTVVAQKGPTALLQW